MGDAVDNQGNSQADLASHLTQRNRRADYRRSTQDQTQRFIANGIYDLPFGKGKKFFTGANGLVDSIVGGFNIGAIVTWATGVPFYVASGRSTFNQQTANIGAQFIGGHTFEEFKGNIGLFKNSTGVFFVNPNILDVVVSPTTGKAVSSTLKAGWMTAPAAGTFGDFPVNSLSGPSYFNFDLSLTKRFRITETVRFEIKGTAINVLNHPNFIYGTVNFDSTSFGRVTTQRGTSRQMNIIAQLRF